MNRKDKLKIGKFYDWLNSWANRDEHNRCHNEAGFRDGYKEAVSDIFNRFQKMFMVCELKEGDGK